MLSKTVYVSYKYREIRKQFPFQGHSAFFPRAPDCSKPDMKEAMPLL